MSIGKIRTESSQKRVGKADRAKGKARRGVVSMTWEEPLRGCKKGERKFKCGGIPQQTKSVGLRFWERRKSLPIGDRGEGTKATKGVPSGGTGWT